MAHQSLPGTSDASVSGVIICFFPPSTGLWLSDALLSIGEVKDWVAGREAAQLGKRGYVPFAATGLPSLLAGIVSVRLFDVALAVCLWDTH